MATSLNGFRALIENSSDAIFLVNPRTEILYASASTARVLGYQPEELLGRNGQDLLHPQDRDLSLQTLKKVLAEPQCPSRIQARIRKKDGAWRWVESTTSNLLNEPHVGAIVINYREIDARKAEEDERLRFAEELCRSNAELHAFAHGVAHDLREPLRTIATFTELLVRSVELNEDNQRVAEFIVSGVRRMTAILEKLLSSAKDGCEASLLPVDLDRA